MNAYTLLPSSQVLSIVDLAQFRPLLLKIEYMHVWSRLGEVYEMLAANGYWEVKCSLGDLCAFHAGEAGDCDDVL